MPILQEHVDYVRALNEVIQQCFRTLTPSEESLENAVRGQDWWPGFGGQAGAGPAVNNPVGDKCPLSNPKSAVAWMAVGKHGGVLSVPGTSTHSATPPASGGKALEAMPWAGSRRAALNHCSRTASSFVAASACLLQVWP